MADPSTRPIWSKRTSTAASPSQRVLEYCSARDVAARPAADARLIEADLWTNRAHCLMLARRGIIQPGAGRAILRGLDQLERAWRRGSFQLDPALEDVHINVERFVATTVGEKAAAVMHTARSRNDQSATDVRLWLREQLLGRVDALVGLIAALSRLAARHAATVCSGWTHGQPAMPSTLGHWAAAHGWALARDAEAARAVWPALNRCPLGAAAAFGTSWPIDREATARLMGFDGPQINSLDCISTRWEVEARAGQALSLMMTHLSSLAQDLIFLSTPPRAGLRLSDAHVSGSSIMPNKRNPDFAEVTRARALAVHGLAANLAGVGRGLLSGYNRDTQWSKYWILDLMDEVGQAPEVFAEVLEGLGVDKALLRRMASEGFSLAADLADHLARTRDIPFRRAYHLVAEAVAEDEAEGWIVLDTINGLLRREKIRGTMTPEELADASRPEEALKARQSQGGPSPGQVKEQARALAASARETRHWATALRRRIETARLKTWRTRL